MRRSKTDVRRASLLQHGQGICHPTISATSVPRCVDCSKRANDTQKWHIWQCVIDYGTCVTFRRMAHTPNLAQMEGATTEIHVLCLFWITVILKGRLTGFTWSVVQSVRYGWFNTVRVYVDCPGDSPSSPGRKNLHPLFIITYWFWLGKADCLFNTSRRSNASLLVKFTVNFRESFKTLM